MANFIPDAPKGGVFDIPFYEQSKAVDIPGRRTDKSIAILQSEIVNLIAKLGGGLVTFQSGALDTRPKRYGYQIHFNLSGLPGRIDIAALPLQSETANKKDRALAQALYFARDWLSVEVHSAMFRPGAIALVPYLIGANGLTVTEALVESHQLPLLVSGR